MVETKILLNKGKKTGAIDDDAIEVGVPQGFRLMEAPPPTSTQAYSILFWEPSSVEDDNPEFEKVVSVLFVYFMIIRQSSFRLALASTEPST